jgi:hypothetical protein
MVGTVTGIEHPAPRVNGIADQSRRVGARIVDLVDGVSIPGRPSPRPGSGVPRAGPLITRSQTGVARTEVGVIRNLRPRSGFSPPYEISYRALKLPRVSAPLGTVLPAARGRFAAGALASRRLSLVIRLRWSEPLPMFARHEYRAGACDKWAVRAATRRRRRKL